MASLSSLSCVSTYILVRCAMWLRYCNTKLQPVRQDSANKSEVSDCPWQMLLQYGFYERSNSGFLMLLDVRSRTA